MTMESDFFKERQRLNDLVLSYADKNMKRLWSLDKNVYQSGALDAKTKEMLGLVASTVLRCDDCIEYHTKGCEEQGLSSEEYAEVMTVALMVGGSITIPHLRRAFDKWDKLKREQEET